MGYDLNRHWPTPSVRLHPTIYATKNILLHYNANAVNYFIYSRERGLYLQEKGKASFSQESNLIGQSKNPNQSD